MCLCRPILKVQCRVQDCAVEITWDGVRISCRMGRHRHKKVSDKDAEENITKQLVESGKKEELKIMLAEKLEECGWKDQVKMACRDVVKEKGLDRITVEDLVQEVAPQGSQLVPDDVKKSCRG